MSTARTLEEKQADWARTFRFVFDEIMGILVPAHDAETLRTQLQAVALVAAQVASEVSGQGVRPNSQPYPYV